MSAMQSGRMKEETRSPTLKFRSTEILDDVFPVGRVFETSQVGLELATENLQRGTLSDTVGSDKTQNLSRTGHRKSVELETVGSIAMGDLALQVGGQVDDGDGIKGAFLRADTTTNAKRLRNKSQAGGRLNFNAKLATSNDRARLFAFLTALAGSALLQRGGKVSMAGYFG